MNWRNAFMEGMASKHPRWFLFIDWLLALPEALEDEFLDEIHELEESTKMRYISSAERIGMKRGTQLGI